MFDPKLSPSDEMALDQMIETNVDAWIEQKNEEQNAYDFDQTY